MKTFFSILFTCAATLSVNAQTIELPETYISMHGDYLVNSDSKNRCQFVKHLEIALAQYDHSDFTKIYDSKDDIYQVTFTISEGEIKAYFDGNCKLVKTFEIYKNVRLPEKVMKALSTNFPNHGFIENEYIVKYNRSKTILFQKYNIKIKHKTSIINISTDESGAFI